MDNEKHVFKIVNKAVPRLESAVKATGIGQYTDDLRMPNMVYGALVHSPYSRARVTGIDISEAEKVPGYIGCAFPEDAPADYYNSSGNPPSPLLMKDELVLTREPKTLFDRILAVAAETEEAAQLAADLVKVDYEVLNPYLSIQTALDPRADPIQPHISENNVMKFIDARQGSVEEGVAGADILVQEHYTTAPMQHTPIELTACLVDFSDGRHLTCYSSSQTIYQERRLLAELFQLREIDVEFIKPLVGGGFGARQQLHSQAAAAVLSRKVGRPVKLIYRREEDQYSVVRHGSETDIRIGATKDGKMTLFDATMALNGGPVTTHTPTVVAASARKLQYNVPNYNFHGIATYTNDVTGGAFRGYGNTQLAFAREVMMDTLADKLGMDPVEFRLMNHVQVGECFPCASIPISSNGIEACARRCQEIQKEVDAKYPPVDNERLKTAWGMCFCCHGSGPSNKDGLSSCILVLNDDATIQMFVGSSDIGQGSETMESQLAAELLDVPLDTIRIKAADTRITPYDTGTFGSSQTFVCGNAVRAACADFNEKFKKQLEKIYEGYTATKGDNSVYTLTNGTDTFSLTFKEAVYKCFFDIHGGVVIGSGTYKADACPNPFSVCFVRCEYHKLLNAIRITDVIQVVDVGTPINRLTVQGQLEGGIAQGMGWALFENMEINVRTRRTHASDLLHYRIPQMGDMPRTYVDMVDSYDPHGACGAKSVGELATVPIGPAIVNAVRHATGKNITKIPLCDQYVILPSRKEEEE